MAMLPNTPPVQFERRRFCRRFIAAAESMEPGTTSPPSSQGLTLGSMRLALQKSDGVKLQGNF
ncbi:hypothetical protein HJA95_15905 [Rhizobium binae]|uniref:hypothetical protein n=1 Tax=Rhizobium binae TaxID=1138190 RepID=UPI001C82DBB2|nr:hypothetical protein [Rhizobium binae]MBX4951026.1 hypothetical protein [Rhizobium binae]